MNAKVILFTLCAGTFLAVLSVVALSPGNPAQTIPGAKIFEVHGQVRAIDMPNRTVRIAHDEIPGYMPAMSMPFRVNKAVDLKGFSAGDTVQFELVVTTNNSWVSHLEKIAAAEPLKTPSTDKADGSLEDRELEGVQTGEIVPDFKLVDQEGRTIQLSQFRGQAVVLTFIYTRCPLPNFWPLMSKNLAELQRRLSKDFPDRYHLLSISMDPDFDRPPVLKDYAARYGASEKDWSFATGDAEQIHFVAGLMGLFYAQENGLISHDLRTALIGPDGRLVQLWKSNVWTPYEVQRLLAKTLSGAKDVAAR